jgi:hypothetical protein
LIDEFQRRDVDEAVVRLASLPEQSVEATLLRRGLSSENIAATVDLLNSAGSPLDVQTVVTRSFNPRVGKTRPFNVGRYGDGKEWGVYYSALDSETCRAEVGHHLRQELSEPPARPRRYCLIESHFQGSILDLVGHEGARPELISPTEDGYPVCQGLAREARNAGVDGLHAPSARRLDGVCVPIFSEPTITHHQIIDVVELSAPPP